MIEPQWCWLAWKILNCHQHCSRWSDTIWSKTKPSEIHAFLTELELALVEHNSILPAQGQVVECMEESILNRLIIEQCIIHDLHNSGHITNNVIIPPCVCIPDARKPWGILRYIKRPHSAMNVVNNWDSSSRGTEWWPSIASKTVFLDWADTWRARCNAVPV